MQSRVYSWTAAESLRGGSVRASAQPTLGQTSWGGPLTPAVVKPDFHVTLTAFLTSQCFLELVS